MRQQIKTITGLFMFGLILLFFCGGCGSGSGDAKTVKLVSAEGEVSGSYSITSSYIYDGQDNLTNIVTTEIMPDMNNRGPVSRALPGAKAAMEVSTAMVTDYRAKYDNNGNVTQVQIWMQCLDGEEVIYSYLIYTCDYTYTENQLTEYTLSENEGPGGMVVNEKKTYAYNDEGDMVSRETYRYDYDTGALQATPYKVVSLMYDANKNVVQVEKRYPNDGNPSGNTYVMTYNSENQLVKHEDYSGVDLVIDDGLAPGYTRDLVYDDVASTVTIINLVTPNESTLLEFLSMDIGYLNMMMGGFFRPKGDVKARIGGPMMGGGVLLAPTNLVQILSASLFYNDFSTPEEILATQLLITEETEIFTGENPYETTYFETTLNANDYPEVMTQYDAIWIYDDVQQVDVPYDLDMKFTWK